jgi:hypothetical protein
MMKARINNELVNVYEIVDVDADDNRVYVRTFKDSEVFCLHAWDVIVSKQDVDNTPEVEPWNVIEDLGAQFIVSGGEVLELDSHLESAYDERNGDIETDMMF